MKCQCTNHDCKQEVTTKVKLASGDDILVCDICLDEVPKEVICYTVTYPPEKQ